MPGPVPRLESELARPRERGGAHIQPVTRGTRLPAKIPRPDPKWHPIARMLWDSLLNSGQSEFYQSSDWAFAYSLCEDLSMYKNPLVTKDGVEYHKRSGQMLQVIYTAMERLMVAEGDRRRVRIELHDPEPTTATQAEISIADYRRDLGVA